MKYLRLFEGYTNKEVLSTYLNYDISENEYILSDENIILLVTSFKKYFHIQFSSFNSKIFNNDQILAIEEYMDRLSDDCKNWEFVVANNINSGKCISPILYFCKPKNSTI